MRISRPIPETNCGLDYAGTKQSPVPEQKEEQDNKKEYGAIICEATYTSSIVCHN